MNVGVQLSSFGQPFRKAVHTAAAVGANCIEIDARTDLRPSELSGTALRQIRKLLNDLNLQVVAIRFQTRRGYDVAEELDRRVVATKAAMKMASDLGARVVVNQIGQVPEDAADSAHAMLRDVLGDLGRFGQHTGAWLGCETGSESLESILSLIRAVPEGSLGVTLNPGNLIVNGYDLKSLRNVAPHILLVHAKDAVPDRARGRGIEVELGRGLAEFPEIIATLEEVQYKGAFVVDRSLAGMTLDRIVSATSIAIEFLRNI